MSWFLNNRRRVLSTTSLIPFENLLLYCRLNNSLVDETGNFTLTGNGITYTNGIYSGVANEAANFNVNTDYILIPDNDLLSFGNGTTDSPFSVSMCINFQANSGDSIDVIFCKRGDKVAVNAGAFEEYQLHRTISTGQLRWGVIDESSNGRLLIDGSTNLLNGVDYHVVVTYDGSGLESGLKIYIDGVEETVTGLSSGTYVAMENLTADFLIGSPSWDYTFLNRSEFIGFLDGFAIWDVALTQEQVTAIYNEQSAGNELL